MKCRELHLCSHIKLGISIHRYNNTIISKITVYNSCEPVFIFKEEVDIVEVKPRLEKR